MMYLDGLLPAALTVTACVSDQQGALQDRHAAQVQSVQLQESHLLSALWDAAVGARQAGAQM